MTEMFTPMICAVKDCEKQAVQWCCWDVWVDEWKYPLCKKHLAMGTSWNMLEDKWRYDFYLGYRWDFDFEKCEWFKVPLQMGERY